MKMKLSSLCLPVICSLLFSLAPAHAALVVNGGFETGDFSGWTEFGPANDPFLPFRGVDSSFPHGGSSFAAYFGDFDTTGGIYQILDTIPGATYHVSFWLQNQDGGSPTSYDVLWNGTSLFGSAVIDSASFPYHQFEFEVTAPSGPGGEYVELRFIFQNNLGYFDLDDVSVTEANPMPEPASLTLWSLGAIAAGLAGHRRRRFKSLNFSR